MIVEFIFALNVKIVSLLWLYTGEESMKNEPYEFTTWVNLISVDILCGSYNLEELEKSIQVEILTFGTKYDHSYWMIVVFGLQFTWIS